MVVWFRQESDCGCCATYVNLGNCPMDTPYNQSGRQSISWGSAMIPTVDDIPEEPAPDEREEPWDEESFPDNEYEERDEDDWDNDEED